MVMSDHDNPARWRIRGLYAITDPQLTPDDRLLGCCAAALHGGAGTLQYRDKRAASGVRRRRAASLRDLCRDHGALLLINDDIELAAAIGAAGVHIGQQDGAVSAARARLGPDALIGVSCHGSTELARAAIEASANYVAFGRFFSSLTKPQAAPAAPQVLATPLPVSKVAIGGITPDNAAALIAAGADALAVIHGLFAAPDIASRARAFQRLFTEEL